MFKLEEEEGRGLALRPVNCPGHAQLFLQGVRSYRDLPLRWAEFGVVHRKEPSGALAGLFRLREFTQDDGHIFCCLEQLADELLAFCRALEAFYRDFGFERLKVGLSTRPPERFGDDAHWEQAERALAEAAERAGMPAKVQPGEGAPCTAASSVSSASCSSTMRASCPCGWHRSRRASYPSTRPSNATRRRSLPR